MRASGSDANAADRDTDASGVDAGREPIRVLIIDDHAALSWALSFVFAREPDLAVVGTAASLAEARTLLATGLELDVALVDLDLPDGSGIDLIPELCAANPAAAAIVLSGKLNDRTRALVVVAGASGLLDKATADPLAIAEAIRAVGRGESLISLAELATIAAQADRVRDEEAHAMAALARLSPRERQILQGIAEGMSDKAIAARLSLSDRTVRNHVVGLLAKLEVDSRLQALLLAHRHGAISLG